MKKILLSCVTCLLALGLVTACDNEDEVVENDGTTQDTGTGGDTGSGGGGSSEPITLENYVVSFSFVDEDGVATTLGDGYTLYLQGSWSTDESGTWTGWIECPYDEETGYYVATFESIDTGTYKYKGVACETGSPSWSGEEVVTDNGGDATLTVTESNSGQVIEVTIVEPTYVYNYTLSITLTNEEGEDPIPSYATAYIAGDWDKWAEFLPLTSEGNGVYSYTFTSITTGWHSFRGYMWYTGETVSWDNCVEIIHDTYVEKGETLPCDASFEVTDEIVDGGKSELSFVVTETLDEEHSSGGSVESVTLYNYTVSFTFIDEDEQPTNLGDGYSLYLQGSWALNGENWADEWIECSYDQSTGYYTATFESIETGTYLYKGVSCETGSPSWTGTEVVTDSTNTSGNATLVVTEDNSGQVIPVTIETPAEAVYLSNYTLTFSFTYGSVETTLPEYGVLYFETEYDNWTVTKLTKDEESSNPTTYSITYSTIATGSYKYDVVLGYDSGPDWTLTKVVDSDYFTVSETDGNDHVNRLSIESAIDFSTLVEITTRENLTVTWYFVNSAANPTEYYSIPEYADAYVCGYFVGTEWTGYSIGGDTKLVSDSSNGYTVTFSEINVGTVTYNMYFEFNGNAQNHSAATSASWDVNHAIESDTNNNTTMIIPATGDAIVYIELNPAEIITDDANFCELTLALKDSSDSGTGKTIHYEGDHPGWGTELTFTETSDAEGYDYYLTINVDKGSSVQCGIYSLSSWADALLVDTNDYGITITGNNNNNIFIPSTLTVDETTLIIFTCDCSAFGGSSNITASSVSVSHGAS